MRLLVLWLLAAKVSAPAPPKLEEVEPIIPNLAVDLRYATPNNFLERPVYPPHARCLLVKEAAERLARAAETLAEGGYRLRVYDCYRPHSVQVVMFKLVPRPGYVADPRKGSPHNRGAAVDLTIEKNDGSDVEMPTPFDTFSPESAHGFPGASAESKANRERLRSAMKKAGFVENHMEWWHYELPTASKYPVQDVPFPLPPRGP